MHLWQLLELTEVKKFDEKTGNKIVWNLWGLQVIGLMKKEDEVKHEPTD